MSALPHDYSLAALRSIEIASTKSTLDLRAHKGIRDKGCGAAKGKALEWLRFLGQIYSEYEAGVRLCQTLFKALHSVVTPKTLWRGPQIAVLTFSPPYLETAYRWNNIILRIMEGGRITEERGMEFATICDMNAAVYDDGCASNR